MVKDRNTLPSWSGAGQLYQFMAAEHARLDELLAQASARAGAIDTEAYAKFRKALLRHISTEEKILLPAAQRGRTGQPLPLAEKTSVGPRRVGSPHDAAAVGIHF